jgi:5-dehydro-2-deoxygluconokinase
MLGLDAAESELVRGFAVGRTIFGEPAQAWFAGRITDEQAKQQMRSGLVRRSKFGRRPVATL